MSHVFHQLYYHFVWATHDRQPLLIAELRPDLLRIQAEEIAQRGGILIRQNCVADHMRLLVRLTPNILLSDFIGQVKGAACYRFNREANPKVRLKWQEGYAVLTLREEEVEKVARYIDNQERLHQQRKLSRVLEILADM
ncbi:MAG TPA: IS200/IS605 family transposase [Gemmataceae bacterium]|jgi:REP element-mobilizing transposase RayT